MTHVFDSRSGCRERLYLLSVLKDPNDSANWAYNSHQDAWHHVGGDVLTVHYEGSESLKRLQARGIDRATALEMVGYPDK